MNGYLHDKAEFLQKKTGKLSLQPHCIVIAGDGEVVKHGICYAIIGEQLFYRVNSLMEAVDVVVKACFVLDLDYPLPARSAWTLVQQAIYAIKTKQDTTSTRVCELLSSLK